MINKDLIECEMEDNWGRKQATRNIWKDYWHEMIYQNPELLNRTTFDSKRLEDIKNWVIKRGKSRCHIFMITVNPTENTKFVDLNKKVMKYIKRKFIDTYMYCYEWRDNNKGMHAHIRIVTNKHKKPSEIRRESYNTFKHLVGNKMHVNVRCSGRKDAFKDYILGIKDGVKKSNWKSDEEMRKKLRLEKYYTNV